MTTCRGGSRTAPTQRRTQDRRSRRGGPPPPQAAGPLGWRCPPPPIIGRPRRDGNGAGTVGGHCPPCPYRCAGGNSVGRSIECPYNDAVNGDCTLLPSHSLAAVLHGPGDLRLEERPIPRPGPGEVLVEVGACAICGSDLHLLDGRFPRARFPVVPGHEFMGLV
ncbi:MAG: alcohol dehydrogenase catalytic domain-containing protein, partial [Candidatus Tectomicrobia bacterium]|nr:alcohol dehydrogenase catalytic domain-containing protein [Candidatus Tectomicrobia bacterium]